MSKESLFAKLRELSSDKFCNDVAVKGLKRGLSLVQGEAKLLAPVHDGQLRNSIKTKVEMNATKVEGAVYTNLEYASFVEFGTGPIGSANHSGISPEVSVSYRSTPWYVHESQILANISAKYNFRIIGEFYLLRGQPASPFLYPALDRNRDKVSLMLKRYVSEKIKELSV